MRSSLVSASLFLAASLSLIAADPELSLVGHWPLIRDAHDSTPAANHGRPANLRWTPDGAEFDGRSSFIEIPDHPNLNFGTGDFTLSLQLHTAAELDDTLGDLLNKYDPAARRGFNLCINQHAGVTGSQANYRNLHFGIDQARADTEWKDEGRPGNAIFIHCMAVHDGDLYAGTVEGRTNNDHGHVYRYDGNGNWIDLGAPWKSNGVTSIASFNGHLYAGVSRVLLHYSGLDPTIAHHIGGKVFRYDNGQWVDLGQLPGVDGVHGMAVFQGKLHVTGFYQPALFRYEGGTDWTSLGSPGGMRPESLCVYNGSLFATGFDEGAVYRFDGETWHRAGLLGDATQVYGIVIHEGKLHAGTWPKGTVYRYEGDDRWVTVGRLGNSEEVMGMNVYNGKLYAGSLPMAEIYRRDADDLWTSVGRIDFTPDVIYRRAWSMAVYKGRLFSGTLPSGHVRSFEAGKNVTDDRELSPGWHHLAAVRKNNLIQLFVDGKPVADSTPFDPASFDLSNSAPLRVGFGAHDYFNGKLRDLRLYSSALTPEQIGRLQPTR